MGPQRARLVTRYEDQKACTATRASASTPAFRETAAKNPPSFLNMDDPDHARIRRMVTGAFAVKRIEAMRPAVQRMTDDLIDQMLAGPKPVDLVEALTLPLPSLVNYELLGVPYEDHDFFQANSKVGLRRGGSGRVRRDLPVLERPDRREARRPGGRHALRAGRPGAGR